MTTIRLSEAIELLQAIVAYRRRNPDKDNHISQAVQQKLLVEVRDTLDDFDITVRAEVPNE